MLVDCETIMDQLAWMREELRESLLVSLIPDIIALIRA